MCLFPHFFLLFTQDLGELRPKKNSVLQAKDLRDLATICGVHVLQDASWRLWHGPYSGIFHWAHERSLFSRKDLIVH